MENKNKDLKFKNLLEKLKRKPIDLIEEKQSLNIGDIIRSYPEKTIFICDAHVNCIERGILKNNILRIGNIVSIDHHAPLEVFAKKISSTNLAIDYVNEKGIVSDNAMVIITHTDYDSIMSALIIRGIVPPKKIFGDMAIIADHTGEANEMVDLLQSMAHTHDLEFSLRNLELWSQGALIEANALKMFEDLKDERKRAKEAVENGSFRKIGSVYYAMLPKKIESAYFPALIPDAVAILLFSPHRKNAGFSEAKIRLGVAAPEGLHLNNLGISEFDPYFGSRWNAGSNKRGGGTKISIEKYAVLLDSKIENRLKQIKNNRKV